MFPIFHDFVEVIVLLGLATVIIDQSYTEYTVVGRFSREVQ